MFVYETESFRTKLNKFNNLNLSNENLKERLESIGDIQRTLAYFKAIPPTMCTAAED